MCMELALYKLYRQGMHNQQKQTTTLCNEVSSIIEEIKAISNNTHSNMFFPIATHHNPNGESNAYSQNIQKPSQINQILRQTIKFARITKINTENNSFQHSPQSMQISSHSHYELHIETNSLNFTQITFTVNKRALQQLVRLLSLNQIDYYTHPSSQLSQLATYASKMEDIVQNYDPTVRIIYLNYCNFNRVSDCLVVGDSESKIHIIQGRKIIKEIKVDRMQVLGNAVTLLNGDRITFNLSSDALAFKWQFMHLSSLQEHIQIDRNMQNQNQIHQDQGMNENGMEQEEDQELEQQVLQIGQEQKPKSQIIQRVPQAIVRKLIFEEDDCIKLKITAEKSSQNKENINSINQYHFEMIEEGIQEQDIIIPSHQIVFNEDDLVIQIEEEHQYENEDQMCENQEDQVRLEEYQSSENEQNHQQRSEYEEINQNTMMNNDINKVHPTPQILSTYTPMKANMHYSEFAETYTTFKCKNDPKKDEIFNNDRCLQKDILQLTESNMLTLSSNGMLYSHKIYDNLNETQEPYKININCKMHKITKLPQNSKCAGLNQDLNRVFEFDLIKQSIIDQYQVKNTQKIIDFKHFTVNSYVFLTNSSLLTLDLRQGKCNKRVFNKKDPSYQKIAVHSHYIACARSDGIVKLYDTRRMHRSLNNFDLNDNASLYHPHPTCHLSKITSPTFQSIEIKPSLNIFCNYSNQCYLIHAQANQTSIYAQRILHQHRSFIQNMSTKSQQIHKRFSLNRQENEVIVLQRNSINKYDFKNQRIINSINLNAKDNSILCDDLSYDEYNENNAIIVGYSVQNRHIFERLNND